MFHSPTLPKYMTQEEVRRFLGKVKSKRDRALFLTIYKYGLRVGEASRLNFGHVDFDRDRLYIERLKGGISGERPLAADVKRVLRAYLRERRHNSEALFTGLQGRLHVRRIQVLFRQYAKKAKLPTYYRVHTLRHSIAVHLLDAGQELYYVKDHLGHKRIQNTEVYAHISSPTRERIWKEIERSDKIVTIPEVA